MITRVDGVRIRILLRSCKSRIAALLCAESWLTLRLQENDSDQNFQKRIHKSLSTMPNPRDRLSLSCIKLLCSYQMREFGNSQAHEASPEEILESIQRNLTEEKDILLALFHFVRLRGTE
jgi:hypothetical protein